MAKQVKLKAEPRTNVGRSGVNKLRARGIIPAVIYGGKVKPQPLQVTARDINAMMSHASGENVLVDLEIAGEKSNRAALVQEVQHSPVGGEIVHVDFHAISMDDTLQAEVAAAGPEVITEKKEAGEVAGAAPAAKEKAPKEKEQKK